MINILKKVGVMNYIFKLSMLTACSLLFFVSLAGAEVEFHPRLTIGEEYNDNLYLTDGNEIEDWITTIEPGINLTYNNRFLDAVIDYSLYYQFYKDQTDANQDNFKDVQRADATALFFVGRPFTLALSEVISREVIDESERNAEYNEIVNRSTVYNTTVTPEYSLQLFPTLSLVVGGTYDRFDYVDSRGSDSEEHEGRVSLVKQLSSSTELYGRYAYARFTSDVNTDEYDRQDYVVGLTQRVGGRTTISAEGGYSDVEYDDNTDADSYNWLIDVVYNLSEPITISINYSQEFDNTIEGDLTKNRDASVRAAYENESLTGASEVYWNNTDYVRTNREDEAYGLRAELSKPLASNLIVNFDAEYERAEYIEIDSDEDIDRFTIGTSLDYEYRRFTASLGYRYRINESDVAGNDYDNNIVTLTGAMHF